MKTVKEREKMIGVIKEVEDEGVDSSVYLYHLTPLFLSLGIIKITHTCLIISLSKVFQGLSGI